MISLFAPYRAVLAQQPEAGPPKTITVIYAGNGDAAVHRFLRRSPAPPGADFRTGELNRGINPVTAIGSFVDSAEYLARY